MKELELNSNSSLFRFGFLIVQGSHAALPDENDHWRRFDFGELAFLLHYEQDMRVYESVIGRAILIGRSFRIDAGSVENVLRELLEDVNEVSLSALNSLSGRFCIVLQNQGAVRIFNDPFGSQTLYYSEADPAYAASHAELLALTLGKSKREDVERFLRTKKYNALGVKYLPGDITSFRDIYALIPNHYLALSSGTITRYWPKKECSVSDFDEFSLRAQVYLGSLARFCAGHEVYLGITGGVDTRVICAAFWHFGTVFGGMTWLGPYSKPREIPVVEELCRRLSIQNTYVDVPGPLNDIARVSGRNSGSFRGPSRLSSAIAAQLDHSARALFVRGYGGEIIRGFYNTKQQPATEWSAAAFSRLYNRKTLSLDSDPGYDRLVNGAFEEFFERGAYHLVEKWGFDVNDIFYWEHRMGMWGAPMLNEMDAVMYSMVGLNDRGLYETAFGLQPGVRLKKSLLRRLIEELTPELVGVRIL